MNPTASQRAISTQVAPAKIGRMMPTSSPAIQNTGAKHRHTSRAPICIEQVVAVAAV